MEKVWVPERGLRNVEERLEILRVLFDFELVQESANAGLGEIPPLNNGMGVETNCDHELQQEKKGNCTEN